MVANTALCRPTGRVVLDTVTLENLDLPVVEDDGERERANDAARTRLIGIPRDRSPD